MNRMSGESNGRRIIMYYVVPVRGRVVLAIATGGYRAGVSGAIVVKRRAPGVPRIGLSGVPSPASDDADRAAVR